MRQAHRSGRTDTVSPAATVKSPTVLKFSPCERDRRAQHHHVGTGDRRAACRRRCASPRARSRRSRSAGSARRAMATRPRSPTTRRTRLRMRFARRHEVDQRRRAFGGLEARLQDQRVGPVAPRDARGAVLRRDQPAAVLGLSQAARRSRRRNRSAASTASRSSRRGRPARRCRDRRSARSLRWAMPWCFSSLAEIDDHFDVVGPLLERLAPARQRHAAGDQRAPATPCRPWPAPRRPRDSGGGWR